MYDYVSGRLASLEPTAAVIDCAGLGFRLEITLSTYDAVQHLSATDPVKLFVHEVIREDEHLLYGFSDEAERAMFRLLIGVSGVGASTARIMLSSLSIDELRQAIADQDAKRIQRVKGVGAKTAQRIVVDLSDKVSSLSASASTPASTSSAGKDEALAALVMLGFPKPAADKVLQSLSPSLSVEELIKQALAKL